MVDQQLITYVREQLRAGYSQEQIRYVLSQQGYPESLIQAAFRATNTNPKQEKKLLRTYVKDAHRRGVSDYDLEQELLSQGYSQGEVSHALVTPEHHSKALFIFPLLAILVLTGGYFFISTDSSPGPRDFVSPDEPLRWGDVSRQVLEMASRNPIGAVGVCESLIERDRTRCINAVIMESSSPSFCENIPYDDLRDTCYLQLVHRGNTEFCEEMVTPDAIRFCNAIPQNTFEGV